MGFVSVSAWTGDAAYGSEYIMPECARCRRTADIGIGRRLVLSALAPLLPLALGRWRWLLRTR